MPRRFFRKFAFKRDALANRWFLSPFRGLLFDDRLWGIRRKTVVPAFSLGLFVACMPFPGHMLVGLLAALALRVNIPVAAFATLASNPLTMAPIYYFEYRVGASLLSIPYRPIEFDMTIDWLSTTFLSIWQPMMLGSMLVGGGAAVVGHAVLAGLWRLSLARYVSARRGRRSN
jgi:uncharacterized protein (DUF2062 family)